MFCSQCAHKLTPSDVYCPNCAKPVASFNFDPGQIPQVEYVGGEELTAVRPPSRDPRVNRFIGPLAGAVIATLGILLVAAIGYIAFVKPTRVVVTNAASPTPDQSAEIRRAEQAAANAQIAINKATAPTQTPKPTATPIDIDAMRREVNASASNLDYERQRAANRAALNVAYDNARLEAQRRGGCYSDRNGLSFDSPLGGVSLGPYQPVSVLGIGPTQYQIQYKDRIGWVSKSVVICFR